MVDHLAGLLPESLASALRSRQRQLLYMERQIQRKFYNEYRAQIR